MEKKYDEIHARIGCAFCNNPQDWYGYIINGKQYAYCEKHKMEWVKFAQERGAIFATHDNDYGVTDGFTACINNLSKEEKINLFKKFLTYKGVSF